MNAYQRHFVAGGHGRKVNLSVRPTSTELRIFFCSPGSEHDALCTQQCWEVVGRSKTTQTMSNVPRQPQSVNAGVQVRYVRVAASRIGCWCSCCCATAGPSSYKSAASHRQFSVFRPCGTSRSGPSRPRARTAAACGSRSLRSACSPHPPCRHLCGPRKTCTDRKAHSRHTSSLGKIERCVQIAGAERTNRPKTQTGPTGL